MTHASTPTYKPTPEPKKVAADLRSLVKFLLGGLAALVVLNLFVMHVEPASRTILQYALPAFAGFVGFGCFYLWRHAGQIERGEYPLDREPDPDAWMNQNLNIPKAMSFVPPLCALSAIGMTVLPDTGITTPAIVAGLVAVVAGIFMNEKAIIKRNGGVKNPERYTQVTRGRAIETVAMLVIAALIIGGALYAVQWTQANA